MHVLPQGQGDGAQDNERAPPADPPGERTALHNQPDGQRTKQSRAAQRRPGPLGRPPEPDELSDDAGDEIEDQPAQMAEEPLGKDARERDPDEVNPDYSYPPET